MGGRTIPTGEDLDLEELRWIASVLEYYRQTVWRAEDRLGDQAEDAGAVEEASSDLGEPHDVESDPASQNEEVVTANGVGVEPDLLGGRK